MKIKTHYFIQETVGDTENTTSISVVDAEERKDMDLPVSSFFNENAGNIDIDGQLIKDKNGNGFPVFDAVPNETFLNTTTN